MFWVLSICDKNYELWCRINNRAVFVVMWQIMRSERSFDTKSFDPPVQENSKFVQQYQLISQTINLCYINGSQTYAEII